MEELVIWKARLLEPKDYEVLVDWWKTWRFTPPPRQFLPDNGTCGVMLEDSTGRQYCAGFLYFTNSKAAWLEFIVSNPEIRNKSIRKEMLTQLIDNLGQFALGNEVEWLFSSVKNKSLIERFTDAGFTTGSKGTVEMIKRL